MNIADTIRQARERLGLTQEDLAEKCEVSRQAVSKWELGVSVPTLENLKILEEVLEVTFETERAEEAPPSGHKPPFWKLEADSAPGPRRADRVGSVLNRHVDRAQNGKTYGRAPARGAVCNWRVLLQRGRRTAPVRP